MKISAENKRNIKEQKGTNRTEEKTTEQEGTEMNNRTNQCECFNGVVGGALIMMQWAEL